MFLGPSFTRSRATRFWRLGPSRGAKRYMLDLRSCLLRPPVVPSAARDHSVTSPALPRERASLPSESWRKRHGGTVRVLHATRFRGETFSYLDFAVHRHTDDRTQKSRSQLCPWQLGFAG